MRYRPHIFAGLGVFFLVLLYTTFRSAGAPPPLPADDREAARRTCQTSVRIRVPDARFPFEANIETGAPGRLRLSGTMDSGPKGQAARRNYECLLRREPSGTYVADSVGIWQSH